MNVFHAKQNKFVMHVWLHVIKNMKHNIKAPQTRKMLNACASNQIVVNGACQNCPHGQIPMMDRLSCMNCPASQISNNGMCMMCSTPGHVPNANQNGCVGKFYSFDVKRLTNKVTTSFWHNTCLFFTVKRTHQIHVLGTKSWVLVPNTVLWGGIQN